MDITVNMARVRERIAAACARAARSVEDVRLVAISKTVRPELIRRAYEAGIRDFGENRVQEAAAKRPSLSDLTVTWHLVGHLQTNKAKAARELFHWIHSLDSLRLAEKLDRSAVCSGERLEALIEVNLGAEQMKSGVREEEAARFAEELAQHPTLALRGLMVIPPLFDDPERTRPYFRRLRELARTIEAKKLPNVSMQHLSMGMSHDFEVAIEEGATMVRIGTAIFGPRQ